MDPIALSIPAFFFLMGVEWFVSWWRGVPVYRFGDWVANLGCGIVQQTSKIALALVTGILYVYLFQNHRLYELDAGSGWVWLACFIGVDFFYYWFHRFSHELNFMWAAHVVHHQSEEYNLGVALRQSAFQGGFSWFFYLPLAFVGFPPVVTGTIRALNALYQFWIHTKLIGRLGPLEWVLNTPSHHRVHHGQNPQYIDRNHAGTLIIWDKMFGTFEPEGEEVVYGVTEPPNSWNPIFANFHHWALTWRRMEAASNWRDKLRVWVDRPGYVPPGMVDTAKREDPMSKYETTVVKPLLIYVSVQFAFLTAATTAYLFYRRLVEPAPLMAWGIAIILTAGSLGALLDHRKWVRPLETFRPAVVSAVFALLLPEQLLSAGPLALLAALSVLSGWGLHRALAVQDAHAASETAYGGEVGEL